MANTNRVHGEDIDHLRNMVGNAGIRDIFADQFMKEYTRFSTMDEFLAEAGFCLREVEDIMANNSPGVNAVVCKNTEFCTIWEMALVACDYYIAKNIC